MADDKRKKKRGRKIKNNLPSCFPSFASYNYKSSTDNRDTSFRGDQPITASSNDSITTDVDNDPHRFSHRRRISRLFKAVFFDSFLVKKKINRSSSKSSATSDTSESASSLSSEKTMKSLNNYNTIHVKESPELDSSLVSSCSRTTSSNSSSFCCSSTNSNSHWSSEPKTTSSRLDLVDFKPNPNPNPNPNPISSINSTTPPDPLPKVPNKPVSSRTLVSSNSLPLPKPNYNHDHNHNRNHNRNKIKSSGTNRNNLLWCLFFLLSLVVLVVYGRIYSILCTSTWFYFVPCRKMKRVNSVGNNSVKVADTDSEQYKKRVIMAGLLDRTRNPIR